MATWNAALDGGALVNGRRDRFESEALVWMPEIYRAAVRMTRDRTRAQDITQEVFLQAWRSFGRFETGTNCKAWLFKILFHCVDHDRRSWWRVRLFRSGENYSEEQLVAKPSIPERLTNEEILDALDSLREEYRAVVMLCDIEELSYKEAAEVLGAPVGTVMSRLSRGRAQLRVKLEEKAKEYGIGGAA
jgi:RNA polymerase sigma-70 factor (ECF subfamily)